jgi:hypothetical protein
MPRKAKKKSGGRPKLKPEERRQQHTITLHPSVAKLAEREMELTNKSLSSIVEAALTVRYQSMGWVPVFTPDQFLSDLWKESWTKKK